jgi:lysophospholipid acyltransferase
MVYFLQRKSGWPVFIFSITSLFILHVYNLYDHYGVWDLEFSTSLMIMVCKYTSFAWCYCDGSSKIPKGSLNPQQEVNKIVELPSFLHYASYIYFFPTAIIGPGHQYAEFRSFIERQDDYATIPDPYNRAGFLALQALGFVFSTLFLLPRYPHTYVLTKEFRERSIFFKLFYANVCVILLRTRYYFGFKVAQINITLCGIAYGGKKEDGTPNWERFFLAKSSAELNYSVKDKVDVHAHLHRHHLILACYSSGTQQSPLGSATTFTFASPPMKKPPESQVSAQSAPMQPSSPRRSGTVSTQATT